MSPFESVQWKLKEIALQDKTVIIWDVKNEQVEKHASKSRVICHVELYHVNALSTCCARLQLQL